MNLKILFIDANSSWLIQRKDLFDLEQIIPPIGLMYIGTYLKHKFGNLLQVKIINKLMDCPLPPDLRNHLKEYEPDIVGIRGLNIYKKAFHETAKTIKQFNRNIKVIGGGPYVSMNMEEAAKDDHIDYFVSGEGEMVMAQILEKLLNNQKISNIEGLSRREDGRLFKNTQAQPVNNLDDLPFPDYNLISTDRYSNFMSYGYNKRKQGVIFSSRGCPYSCIYCHNIFGKKYRARSPLNIFQEIENLYKNFGIKDFYFVDDNFNFDYRRSMDLFDLIIKNGLKINMYLANGIRGDIIDYTFIDKMVEAGVIWVTFSVETASKRLQKFIKKFINIEKITDNIHYACQKNIMVNCCIMVGFPTETLAEAYQTIEYVKQFKKIIIPMFFSVKYYPNTEIYDLALKNGIKTDKIEDAYAETYHNIKHSQTPLIPQQAFKDIYFEFLNEVFLSKERLLNAVGIQKKFLTEQEILDVYSIFFRKRIKNLEEDVLHYAK